MDLHYFLIIGLVSILLASLQNLFMRRIVSRQFWWSCLGLPIGMAVGMNLMTGVLTLVIALAFSTAGGLLGYVLVNQLFPQKNHS